MVIFQVLFSITTHVHGAVWTVRLCWNCETLWYSLANTRTVRTLPCLLCKNTAPRISNTYIKQNNKKTTLCEQAKHNIKGFNILKLCIVLRSSTVFANLPWFWRCYAKSTNEFWRPRWMSVSLLVKQVERVNLYITKSGRSSATRPNWQ